MALHLQSFQSFTSASLFLPSMQKTSIYLIFSLSYLFFFSSFSFFILSLWQELGPWFLSIVSVIALMIPSIMIFSLFSDSSDDTCTYPSISYKKRPSSVKKKDSKKPYPNVFGSFSLEDMKRFWRVEQKNRYELFNNRPIVPSRVANLSQLKESHYLVSSFLKARKLSLLFIFVILSSMKKLFIYFMLIFMFQRIVVSWKPSLWVMV